MAVTENRVAGLQERLKEVMKCEQLNKQQFMKVTDIRVISVGSSTARSLSPRWT